MGYGLWIQTIFSLMGRMRSQSCSCVWSAWWQSNACDGVNVYPSSQYITHQVQFNTQSSLYSTNQIQQLFIASVLIYDFQGPLSHTKRHHYKHACTSTPKYTKTEMFPTTYGKIGRIQSMLLVFVGAVDVTLAEPQDLVRARTGWRQLPRTVGRYVIEPGGRQLLTCEIGPRQVEVVRGVDAPRAAQKLVVELLVKPALFGDDAVHDARLIALRPHHFHLGVRRTETVTELVVFVVQRRCLLLFDEKCVEPEVKHLFLITPRSNRELRHSKILPRCSIQLSTLHGMVK